MANTYEKIYNFLVTSPPEHITAFSVIYQVMEEDPWLQEDVLREMFNNAIEETLEKRQKNIKVQEKLLMIPNQFDIAFEGVCSLRDIEIPVKPLSYEEIKNNMRDLKKKLTRSEFLHAEEIRQTLDGKNISDFSWRDPLASQVISDDADIVENLDDDARELFMKPAGKMQIEVPDIIQEKCREFVENFDDKDLDILPEKLRHDNNWKESEEKLVEIADGILNILGDVWKNPAFRPEFASTQSEGTYVTDILVPLLRATLKELPIGGINLLSTAERQSIASAYRRGEGKQGKRPDVMFIKGCRDKLYELIFVECSRLVCSKSKKENDKVKLWREMNDGMTYVHTSCKPDKDDFGVLGIQVAGELIHFNVLIKDTDDIHRLYHLRSVEIPVQPTDREHVLQFVETLLLIRNIIIVNISLLMHAPVVRSERQKRRKSSTVTSDPE